MQSYEEFLASKATVAKPCGLGVVPELNPKLFPFQRDIVAWALKRGRACLFADCGMGKAFMSLEWSRVVHDHTGGNILILAPLAVSKQTVREGEKFGITVNICRTQEDVRPGINVTNYEMLHHFDASSFVGVVADESSILKSYSGATRNQIIESFKATPYKLACTATPAPNDHMELGNHSEFMGVMTRPEMLSMFMIHDGGDTSQWRLKGHAETAFWKWVCSWAVMIRKPSDLGYSDDGFDLPLLRFYEHVIESTQRSEGMLFAMPARTLQEQRAARRATMEARVAKVAELVNASNEPWLVWCELNDEGNALEKAIGGAVQVAGADSDDAKESRMLGFSDGTHRVLVSKPSLAGHGMNWQHCPNVAYVGLSHSWEQFYQSVRRCWRYGQTRPVNVHVVTTNLEMAVLENIKRKEADAERMASEMVSHMRETNIADVRGTRRDATEYLPLVKMRLPAWLRTEVT